MADTQRQRSRTVPHTNACVRTRFFVRNIFIQRTLHDGVLMRKPECPRLQDYVQADAYTTHDRILFTF
jgi:hypothetical protein